MATSDLYTPDFLPVYIKYERLTVRSLAELYAGFANISEFAIRVHAEAAGLKPDQLPAFELVTAKTGDSVKFRFGERWLPSITSNEEHDIVVDVPKKLGIPLLVGYLVLGGAKLVLGVRNSYLDSQIKVIERQLKETELQKTLQPQANDALNDKAAHIVHQVIDNRDFSTFMVYDIDIMEFRGGEMRKHKRNWDED